MIEDRITEANYYYLVGWFRDMVYSSLIDTMTELPSPHYDKTKIDAIQSCEFDEYMDGTGWYYEDILYTDDEKFAVNDKTKSTIIDAFNEARIVELENFYFENKEYIW